MQKRRQYFSNPSLQAGFLWKFGLLAVLEAGLIYGLFWSLSRDTVTTGFRDAVLTLDTTREFFAVPFFWMMLAVLVAVVLAGMIVLTILTHRIAGPLYRLQQVLKKVRDGDLSATYRVRRHDSLHPLQHEVNDLLRCWDDRLVRLKTGLRELNDLLAADGAGPVKPEVKSKAAELLREAEQFTLSSDTDDGS